MKSGSIIFNAIVLVLIGVLFYLHFAGSSKPKSASAAVGTSASSSADPKDFRIAYFEMDSLEDSFSMVKDVKNELAREEDAINAELARMEKQLRDKANRYQGQAASMSQVQSELATKDMMQTQQEMQNKKSQLEQRYQDLQMRKMKDVKTKIEEYLKQYNQDKGYAYIFANEPGIFYYRDSMYNITGDVIKGLNDTYGKKK
jgi:outer membrane protein